MKTKPCLLLPKMSFSYTVFFLSFPLYSLSILVHAYTPVDLFRINCGSHGSSPDDVRSWTGDVGSKFLSSQGNSAAAQALTQSPSATQIPYTTARLSHSQFSYSFSVSRGQKFIRLFFYPASYPGFDRFNAFFTVKSGGFTFLKDFNASLTADAKKEDTIIREYCVNIDDGERLNLTFTPNTTNLDYYAFINGIEIVSMPDDFYYSKPDGSGLNWVGSTTGFNILKSFALETGYRLNVGGNRIPEEKDTGMLRSWDADDDYVKTESFLPAEYDTGTTLIFTLVRNYTAPDQVYRTERSMGKNKTHNMNSNLTWVFPVDGGFKYFLRLHFCELNPDISDENNRLFNIYIADQLAESANVLNWGNGKGVPVYKDYAVIVPQDQRKTHLSLKMHPGTIWSSNRYSDAFLNGLEIFKISNPESNNLAGPNPDPLPPTSPIFDNLPQKNSKKTRIPMIIGVVIGPVVFIVVLISCVACFLICSGKKVKEHSKSSDGTSKWVPFSFATTKSGSTTNGTSLPSELCRHFSIAEIRAATNNFDELFNVGVGGFGNVYKGYIDGGQTPVAIKRLKPGSQQGVHEFKTEIEMLSQLRHLHLVPLIGYCSESNEMILVYDFMARGTLCDHLYNTDNPPLAWKQRLQICIGAAKGLHYLHTGARHIIIHRDVKTTNILLDEKWVAKVSDFGLSRIGPTGMSKAHVSTVVKGSVGYLDPEYYKRQRLTEKSDVYSLGVVLFEILCARPAVVRTVEKEQVSLADWARHCYQVGSLALIVDPALMGKISPECLRKFGEIAVSCLNDDGTQRPSMNDVVWGLEFVLRLQENAEQREQMSESGREEVEGGKSFEGSDDLFSSGPSVGHVSELNKSSNGMSMSMTTSSGEHSYGNKETDRLISSAYVFSEIMDPKAR